MGIGSHQWSYSWRSWNLRHLDYPLASERSRNKAARQAAASSLAPAIRNVRDAAVFGRHRFTGGHPIYPLANQLAASRGALTGSELLKEVDKFEQAARTLRDQLKNYPWEGGQTRLPDAVDASVKNYMNALDARANWLERLSWQRLTARGTTTNHRSRICRSARCGTRALDILSQFQHALRFSGSSGLRM